MLSSATMHKPGTQTPGAPGWWDSAPNSVVVYTIHIGTCNSVHVCIQTSFFCAFWRAEQNGCSESGWKSASFGLINLCDCICKWYNRMASLHPSWSAATPGLGWKKGFSMHYSPAQKHRTEKEGCAFQFINTVYYRNSRCWNDDLIHSRNWINLWKQAKEVKRRRLDPNLVSKFKLESNILPVIFHVHKFSFPVCLLWVLSEAQEKQWKPVNTTARSCTFPASWPNLLKNLSRMVPSKSFANAVLESKPTGVGGMEEFSKWHRDVQCRRNQTHKLQTSSSASCSGLIKSFQAAGDNNAVNRAS